MANNSLPDLAHDLLRRVVRDGLADRFLLMDVAPRDAVRCSGAFARLIEEGYVIRTTVSAGEWFYSLSSRGLAAARADHPPQFRRMYEGD